MEEKSRLRVRLQRWRQSQARSGRTSTTNISDDSLRERLQRLYNRTLPERFFPDTSLQRKVKGITEVIEGIWRNTTFGDIFVAQKRFPPGYKHGSVELRTLLEIRDNWLNRLCNNQNRVIDFRRAVFIDTETTGLSGGTGTMAFLVGVGYFSGESFLVEQYFVDELVREEGMLDLLRELLMNFDVLITYNGKAFDLPVLENRFLLNRLPSPFEDKIHLDLLHPGRRLWTNHLPDLRLATLEQEVLHVRRDNDIPGEEAPQRYFHFLQTGNAEVIARVFYHNQQDILSLAALSLTLYQRSEPHSLTDLEQSQILRNRARIYLRQGLTSPAIEQLERCLHLPQADNQRIASLLELARIYKKEGLFSRAIQLWQSAITIKTAFHLEPYLELAKFYEHRTREYIKALGYVDQALEQLPGYRHQDREALEHRRKRLLRKLLR